TRGPHLTYQAEKLSMERVEDAAFGPTDRIGQLTMRNLDIADSREKLELYAAQGTLGSSHASLIGEIEAGGAAAIAELGAKPAADDIDAAGLRSAMDSGTD